VPGIGLQGCEEESGSSADNFDAMAPISEKEHNNQTLDVDNCKEMSDVKSARQAEFIHGVDKTTFYNY
jgi:hypothetical protein